MKKKNIYQFYTFLGIFDYLGILIYTNFLFLLVNAPLILVLLIADLRIATLPIYFVVSLPLAVSLGALLKIFSEPSEKKSNKVFFEFFKQHGSKITKIWSIIQVLLGVTLANLMLLEYFLPLRWLKWFFYLIYCIIITFSVNTLAVFMKRNSLKKSIQISAYLCFKYPFKYNLTFMILLGTLIIFINFPPYGILIGISIACKLISMSINQIV